MYSWPLCFSQLYTKPEEVEFMPRLTTALTDKELRKKLRDLERVGEPETFSVGGVAGLRRHGMIVGAWRRVIDGTRQETPRRKGRLFLAT